MSTELSWSTKTLAIANLSLSTIMTMRSSCAESIAIKSSFVKRIGGILCQSLAVVEWTDCIALRCFLQAELEHPPHANPLTIAFITSRMLVPNGILDFCSLDRNVIHNDVIVLPCDHDPQVLTLQ